MSIESIALRVSTKKTFQMEELAKTFLKLQKQGALTKGGKFFEAEKNKILVILNNMAVGKPGKLSFPFIISSFCKSDGVCSYGRYEGLSAKSTYKKLAEFFKSEGFLAKPGSRKIKCKSGKGYWYDEYLVISGVKNMKSE